MSQRGYHPLRAVHACQPGDHYQIDLAQLPQAYDGSKYILVCVDVFTGFVMLKALSDKRATTVARALFDIFSVIGIPRLLQSDNGSEFVNSIITAMTHLLGVHRRYVSAYNPRASGKVERCIRTVKSTIIKLMRGANVFWPLHLSYVQFAYNDKIHSLSSSTPFSLMFARNPNAPHDYSSNSILSDVNHVHDVVNDVNAWKQHQHQLLSLIYPAINASVTKKQKQYIDKINNTRVTLLHSSLETGTKVMLRDPKYVLNPSMKPTTEATYIGPYYIVDRTDNGEYHVKDDTGEILEIPLDQMKVLPKSTTIVSVDDDDDDSDNVYVVSKILKHRIISDNDSVHLEYFVHWKGYSDSDDSWIRDTDLIDTPMVDRYFRALSAKEQLSVDSIVSQIGWSSSPLIPHYV